MIIKEAKESDLQKILELQKICFQEAAVRYNDQNIQPLRQTLEELEKEYQLQTFLIAEEDSKIIGSVRAFCENDTCFIGKLIVHPDFQNKGIGRKLMAEIETKFLSSKKYRLFTGEKDTKNISFYQKLGYTIYTTKTINDDLVMLFMEKGDNRK